MRVRRTLDTAGSGFGEGRSGAVSGPRIKCGNIVALT